MAINPQPLIGFAWGCIKAADLRCSPSCFKFESFSVSFPSPDTPKKAEPNPSPIFTLGIRLSWSTSLSVSKVLFRVIRSNSISVISPPRAGVDPILRNGVIVFAVPGQHGVTGFVGGRGRDGTASNSTAKWPVHFLVDRPLYNLVNPLPGLMFKTNDDRVLQSVVLIKLLNLQFV